LLGEDKNKLKKTRLVKQWKNAKIFSLIETIIGCESVTNDDKKN
jgi:hypothetical protein